MVVGDKTAEADLVSYQAAESTCSRHPGKTTDRTWQASQRQAGHWTWRGG